MTGERGRSSAKDPSPLPCPADTGSAARVRLAFARLPIESFHGLFQEGVLASVSLGSSLREVLGGQLGFDPALTAELVKTVFLDGRPVDDLDHAFVREGSVLSLSGAMPGLVGASLRMGGVLAPLRGSISQGRESSPSAAGEGTIRLKLFNLLMDALGPQLLRHGVLLAAAVFADFVARRPAGFWEDCREILLDGEPVEPARLAGHLPGGRVRLSIVAAGADA
jgi:hypothetical protein